MIAVVVHYLMNIEDDSLEEMIDENSFTAATPIAYLYIALKLIF